MAESKRPSHFHLCADETTLLTESHCKYYKRLLVGMLKYMGGRASIPGNFFDNIKDNEGFHSFQHETYKYVRSSNFTTNLLKCIGSSIYPTKRLGLGCLCSNMQVFNMFFDTWDKPKLNIKTLNPLNRL